MQDLSYRRFLFVFLIAICFHFTSSQQQQPFSQDFQPYHHQPYNQHDIQQKQYQLQQQFKHQLEEQQYSWIAKQHQHNQHLHQLIPQESAIFHIQSNDTQIYRIAKTNSNRKMVGVNVYEVTPEGDIVMPENPDEESYIRVKIFNSKEEMNKEQHEFHDLLQQDTVYLSKTFQLIYPKSLPSNPPVKQYKYLKIHNSAKHALIVILDIQQQSPIIQIALSDSKFEVTQKKIITLLEQSKGTQINRQHLYKWQWGFYEKHQRHQMDMLGFTGAELLIIIVTSVVQMYCIKNLVNDELVI